MRKSIRFILAIIFFLTLTRASVHAEINALHGYIQNAKAIKVYVKDPVNESTNAKLKNAEFKKAIDSAFAARKSVAFTVVSSPSESDIQVESHVKQFQYLDRGPLKPTVSPGTMALDMMATADSNYADMDVRFLVTDTKSNKVLWDDSVYVYIKKKMTEEGSFPLVFDKIARKFVAKSFGKK